MRVVYTVLVGEMPNPVRELPNFVQKQVGWPEPVLQTVMCMYQGLS